MLATLTRSLLGLGVLGFGGWTMAGTFTASSGFDAVLNARLLQVRAPDDGFVDLVGVGVGQAIQAGEPVARLKSNRAMQSGSDLPANLASAKAELAALTSQGADLGRMHDGLEQQADAYQSNRTRQLTSRLEEVRASLAAAQAQEKQTAADAAKQRAGYRRRWISQAAVQSAGYAVLHARMERQALEQRIETQTIELAAARQGTYIGDGYNDTSYSKQRADDLALRLAELNAQVVRQTAKVQALVDLQAAAEPAEQKAKTAQPIELLSPGAGRLWSTGATSGQFVRSGDLVVQVADCSKQFVQVNVSNASYASVRAGDAAFFRPQGEAALMQGRVVWAGAADRGIEDAYKGVLDANHADGARLSFVIAIDDTADARTGCKVGRPGRLLFDHGDGGYGAFTAKLVDAAGIAGGLTKEGGRQLSTKLLEGLELISNQIGDFAKTTQQKISQL